MGLETEAPLRMRDDIGDGLDAVLPGTGLQKEMVGGDCTDAGGGAGEREQERGELGRQTEGNGGG